MITKKYSMTHSQALRVLNCAPGASKKRLKKAYRKAAMKHHPDKGGKQEDFVIVKEAYDLLVEQGTAKRVEHNVIHLAGLGNVFGGVVHETVYYRRQYSPAAAQKVKELA